MGGLGQRAPVCYAVSPATTNEGHLFVEDVRKGRLTEVTDVLVARGSHRMAKLVFSLMRQMFCFAVERDYIEHDPSASIRKAKIGGKNVERDRALSEQEIALLHPLSRSVYRQASGKRLRPLTRLPDHAGESRRKVKLLLQPVG